MAKLTLSGLALPLFLLFASPPASAPKAFGAMKQTPENQGQTGTLQKMIVESGSKRIRDWTARVDPTPPLPPPLHGGRRPRLYDSASTITESPAAKATRRDFGGLVATP